MVYAPLLNGYVPFGNGGSALATSSLLYWDNTDSRLGIGTTSPTQALAVNGNVAIVGGISLQGNGTSTLTDLQGTSQYLFNSFAPRLWQLADGTALNPVTTSGATFKISRTESVASSTCGNNKVDNECNAALLVTSVGLPTSSMQVDGILSQAEGSPIGTGAVRNAVGIRYGIFPGNMKLSFQAARSIG